METGLRANFEHVQQLCDEQIRRGRVQLARAELRKLTHTKIPAPMVASFADLTRRTGLFHLGLKWLNSRVRPAVANAIPPTTEEKVAYAALLIKVGCLGEAREILDTIPDGNPEASLYKAFINIHQWEYAKAIPLLNRYISSRGLQPYHRMIGRMNLASAYVALDEFEKGGELLNAILEETAKRDWALFHNNALELSIQMASAQGDWPRAQKCLDLAAQRSEKGTITDLYLMKWKTILALRRDGPSPLISDDLLKLRLEAEKVGDWPTVRECDFHRAHANSDRDLMLKIYFGTPFGGYRKRIEGVCSDWLTIPAEHVLSLDGTSPSRILDLSTGRETGGRAAIEVGSVPYRLLRVLASDIYRPLPLVCLFAMAYPGDYFDPFSSTKRTLQQVHRLRGWLRENEIPLEVHHYRDGYALKPEGSYGLLVKREIEEAPCNLDARFLTLKQAFAKRCFTTSEAAKVLHLSRRSVQVFLAEAERDKKIQRIGRGRATVYRIPR